MQSSITFDSLSQIPLKELCATQKDTNHQSESTAFSVLASVTNRLDGNTGDEDLTESCRRLCLVCGSAEKELSLYVLRRPEDLNGWIHMELSSIQSSFLISNDQKGKICGNMSFKYLE